MAEVIHDVCKTAHKKLALYKKGKGRYFVSSALAGLYIGLGIILIYTVGGYMHAANSPMTKVAMGAFFGIALSLVMMCGADLFTGNTLVMPIASLEKEVSWKDTFKIWGLSYFGNLIGSIVLAFIYKASGLASGHTGEFISEVVATKMTTPYGELIVRGILCNILVCLAVWCTIKLKEETAKLIMIFWCLFAFITSGFEHSIANMFLLATGLLVANDPAVSIAGYIHNISAVTIGNIIGGVVFVALAYWYIGKEK
ncbi:formate/nitrite transporter [Clostridium cellulovorans 743B]|uniref:Formate/nitrite transporter n=2 Tax=Clostridium cellulovorans TaxID=1493 RepID=D9SMP6_CLOC7|nr:formate/nitrite transporter family protein [Clostridium cellulovorans]ADL49831.1 formate/nitrite transporter [Clostridium cellulovorans 743B]